MVVQKNASRNALLVGDAARHPSPSIIELLRTTFERNLHAGRIRQFQESADRIPSLLHDCNCHLGASGTREASSTRFDDDETHKFQP